MRFNLINFAQKNLLIRGVIVIVSRARSRYYLPRIEKYLTKGETILDFGSGTTHTTEILRNKKYDVTPIDIVNLSFADGISPVIYNGQKIPFKDKYFDVVLVVTVLHHIKNPEIILKEISRVAKKVIIVEEVYNSTLKKYATFIWDSVVNIEFYGHPHSNKTDEGWKKTFKELKLDLLSADYQTDFGFLDAVTYFLQTK